MTGRTEKILFHHSVKGESHKRKGTVCQDASDSRADGDCRFIMAAVADGHGDPTCLRSDRGSVIAVSVALDCLQIFGESYATREMILADSEDGDGRSALRQLTDAIVSRWSAAVRENIQEDPLTEEELVRSGPYEEYYREGEYLERVYGSTLVAALEGDDYLLLLQQGDGRCDLLYEDGTMDAPIPPDERCYDNVTTSLADDEASREIRSVLLSQGDERPAACFLSSDGVENGFYDDAGRIDFTVGAGQELVQRQDEPVSEVLRPLLDHVSEYGNGDDVSLAGWIDARVWEGAAASVE